MDYSELVGGGLRHFRVVSEVLEVAETQQYYVEGCRRHNRVVSEFVGDTLGLYYAAFVGSDELQGFQFEIISLNFSKSFKKHFKENN